MEFTDHWYDSPKTSRMIFVDPLLWMTISCPIPCRLARLLPRKLRWNINITQLKRKIIFQTSIFGIHDSYQRGIFLFFSQVWWVFSTKMDQIGRSASRWGYLAPSANLKFADVPNGIAAITKAFWLIRWAAALELGKKPMKFNVFSYFRKKNSILVGVYNQQFQGTIFLMVFHLQGMDWFYWRKKCLCMGFGMTIILRQGLYWNPMKWWWNIWGNAWTKTHMDTVWKPYSVDDLQSTSSFPER